MTALLALLACSDTATIPLHFDGPVAAAVLTSADGPFVEPVGYVANRLSGVITPLDLKHGRLLTDDPTASFLRAAAIPTGSGRLLSDVAVVGGGDVVMVWAIDQQNAQILHVPHVTGLGADGAPAEPEAAVGEVRFVDVDGSGDAPTLSDVEVRTGFTTTEDWSIEHDGARWWAKGARSGVQSAAPVSGEAWASDARELSFVLEGTATKGDRFELRTESGLREITLEGARPLGLLALDGRVYVTGDHGVVTVFDGITGAAIGAVGLPEGAQPGRLTGAPDGRVFATDGASAVVWILSFDLDPDPTTVAVEALPVAAPLVDLAWVGGEDAAGVPFDHLFVAPIGAGRVDVWDLAGAAWVDPNPLSPEVEGVALGSPITGLAASRGPVTLPHADAYGAYPRVPTVAVATGDGYLFQLEGPTGCAVRDARGPHAPNPLYDGQVEYAGLVDLGAESDESLLPDEVTGEQVVTSPCGGVALGESWTLTYQGATLDWSVEGTLSGLQAARARSDERYLSDDGAISFVIASGARPATDGDSFTFTIDRGLSVVRCSDVDGDSACGTNDTAWDFPGRPATFETLNGPVGGGWDAVDRRQYGLLPVTLSDLVARVRLEAGDADVRWQ